MDIGVRIVPLARFTSPPCVYGKEINRCRRIHMFAALLCERSCQNMHTSNPGRFIGNWHTFSAPVFASQVATRPGMVAIRLVQARLIEIAMM